MKKIFIFLILFLFSLPAHSMDNVSFIYINGSNNNDETMANWYEKGVRKLHPVLRKKFLKNSAIKKYYKVLGGLNINEEPIIYFWGYKSKDDLEFVKSKLEISKAVSSIGAFTVKTLLTEYLHDAIWVQKPRHMIPIVDDLNEYVKNEAKKGNQVVLYGYSAGTFVTYEYMFNKLRFVDVSSLLNELGADKSIVQYAKDLKIGGTCVSAISNSKYPIGTISQTGHLVLNQDKEQLKHNLSILNETTEESCAPVDKFRGIVNFASPLPLFYSDLGGSDYELNYYNKYMFKYVLENAIFFLTVNFREDPLGFPTSRNLTLEEMEEIMEIKTVNPTGMIYDNSSVWSMRPFLLAHTSYWSARRIFSNAIVKGFVNGYKFQYDKKYQSKVIKRNKKSSEL